MHKTLILTGWSKTVYMPAAAAALEALKWKADVAGVSMDALVGALKDRAPNYKTVFVLGVGLKKNIGQTISTLMELKTKGVRTVWLSSMPVAPEFAAEVCLEGVDPAVLRRLTFKQSRVRRAGHRRQEEVLRAHVRDAVDGGRADSAP